MRLRIAPLVPRYLMRNCSAWSAPVTPAKSPSAWVRRASICSSTSGTSPSAIAIAVEPRYHGGLVGGVKPRLNCPAAAELGHSHNGCRTARPMDISKLPKFSQTKAGDAPQPVMDTSAPLPDPNGPIVPTYDPTEGLRRNERDAERERREELAAASAAGAG